MHISPSLLLLLLLLFLLLFLSVSLSVSLTLSLSLSFSLSFPFLYFGRGGVGGEAGCFGREAPPLDETLLE